MRLLLYTQNGILCRLRDSELNDGFGRDLDLLLSLWVDAGTRLPFLLYQLSKPRQHEFAFFANCFISKARERIQEECGRLFVRLSRFGERDLKFGFGHGWPSVMTAGSQHFKRITVACRAPPGIGANGAPFPFRRVQLQRVSSLKQSRRNHPADLPASVGAALEANDAAILKLYDSKFLATGDEQCDQFAEKGQVANNHHVAAGLFERLFRCRNGILWPKTFARYDASLSPDRLCEQFGGLLRASFAAVSNGIDRERQGTQKLRHLLHLADSLIG